MKIHRFYILISFYILLFSKLEAKEEDRVKLNSFNFELGGSGGSYSFNYDRLIPLNSKLTLNLGIGLSPQLTHGLWAFTLMPTTFVNSILYYKLRERKSLLFGLGFSAIYGNDVLMYGNSYYAAISSYLGYRYDFKNQKYYVTASFSPWIFDNGYVTNSLVFEPWISVSYGYKFNKIERRNIYPKEDSAKINSISGSIGIVNYKARLQYERGYKEHSSNGLMLTCFFGEFPGIKLDAFTRQYHKKQSNTEGFFLQEKIGVGYLFSGMYDEHEENISGITVGGGVAGGYKLMIGNHLNVEAILGAQYYIAPIVGKNTQVMYGQENQKEWWYSTTGIPLDFQFKFGWQY